MAKTNFGALTDHQKMVWSRDVWTQARNKMFLSRFMGKGQNSMIQRITELTKTERGDAAVITLVPDHDNDGIAGDNDLVGNETELKAYDEKIQIDQLRQAHRNTGRLADQKTVVNFRETARDQLSYWLADRMDQLAFLTMSGIAYTQTNDGAARPQPGAGQNGFSDLAFAADVSAPTGGRHLRISGTTLADGDTTAITAADTIGYRHIVELQAIAKERYLRGVKGPNGSETYHLFLNPTAMAKLKLDADFISNARHAGVRGSSNTLWAGGDSYMVDGVMIHEYRHVYNTRAATGGNKWGAAGAIDGARALFCGAQALGFIDLGDGIWDERDHFDYGNQFGISYGKLFGMKKPVFKGAKKSQEVDGLEDYGVIALDMAL